MISGELRRTFHGLQAEANVWRERNFPHATADDQFMGVVEELGELAQANLKHKQGIRGFEDPEVYGHEAKDAVGGLIIFLSNWCSKRGFDLEECVNIAAGETFGRDWVSNPENGE